MLTLSTKIKEKIALLQEIQTAMEETVGLTCEAIADVAVENLIHEAPFDEAENNMTPPGEEGHLNESFYATSAIYTGNAKATTIVKTDEPIKFSYVTEGTDTPILPRTKKAMWWPDAPHPMYAVSGQEPNPFAELAHQMTVDETPAIIAEQLKTVLALLKRL